MVLKIERRKGPIVLFSYIPRTGGTWLRKVVLEGLKIPHRFWRHGLLPDYSMAHTLLYSHFKDSGWHKVDFAFSFVRHPITYYESTWRILHNEEWRERTISYKWHPHKSAGKRWVPDFNEWVSAMIEEEPAWFTRLVDLYVGPEGEEFVDYVGRIENLYRDTARMLIRSGTITGRDEDTMQYEIEQRFARPVNHTSKREMPVEWDTALKVEVLHFEKAVIERFYSDMRGG